MIQNSLICIAPIIDKRNELKFRIWLVVIGWRCLTSAFAGSFHGCFNDSLIFYARFESPGVTACQPNHGWEVTIVSENWILRQGSLAFGPRCNPGNPSWISLPKLPLSWGLPSADLESRLSLSFRCQHLEVWGGKKAPRTVWSNQAARTRNTLLEKLIIFVCWLLPFSRTLTRFKRRKPWILLD